ncbi:unnamed protein product [Rodentolepis nana]|uniref:PH domain-containing protein n=1 Tax=Rodentolepis nana TaxID=102285 RepID=A0A0R3TRB7_RODNA|nr:unnamed protein product [Rodentolepis nana]
MVVADHCAVFNKLYVLSTSFTAHTLQTPPLDVFNVHNSTVHICSPKTSKSHNNVLQLNLEDGTEMLLAASTLETCNEWYEHLKAASPGWIEYRVIVTKVWNESLKAFSTSLLNICLILLTLQKYLRMTSMVIDAKRFCQPLKNWRFFCFDTNIDDDDDGNNNDTYTVFFFLLVKGLMELGPSQEVDPLKEETLETVLDTVHGAD